MTSKLVERESVFAKWIDPDGGAQSVAQAHDSYIPLRSRTASFARVGLAGPPAASLEILQIIEFDADAPAFL